MSTKSKLYLSLFILLIFLLNGRSKDTEDSLLLINKALCRFNEFENSSKILEDSSMLYWVRKALYQPVSTNEISSFGFVGTVDEENNLTWGTTIKVVSYPNGEFVPLHEYTKSELIEQNLKLKEIDSSLSNSIDEYVFFFSNDFRLGIAELVYYYDSNQQFYRLSREGDALTIKKHTRKGEKFIAGDMLFITRPSPINYYIFSSEAN